MLSVSNTGSNLTSSTFTNEVILAFFYNFLKCSKFAGDMGSTHSSGLKCNVCLKVSLVSTVSPQSPTIPLAQLVRWNETVTVSRK
jgi:hypothetical protein